MSDFWVVPIETTIGDGPATVNIAVLADTSAEAIAKLRDDPKVVGDPVELGEWLEKERPRC